jgi:imidazolonepropionase
MESLPLSGPLKDTDLKIIENGAILLSQGRIADIGSYDLLKMKYPQSGRIYMDKPVTCLPGFIDAHTHLCWGGSRAADYASRIAGKSYLEISREGGGINLTVKETRRANTQKLSDDLKERAWIHLREGVTTCEVKSGYGLDRENELKILSVINDVGKELPIDLIPTVLAAHTKPFDFKGSNREYLDYILKEVLPEVKKRNLAERADIFIDNGAFSLEEGEYYLQEVQKMGFSITVHADQFTPGSSPIAVKFGALSADHLESISEEDLEVLVNSQTAAVALPGCSLGLGINYAPARRLLDRGASLVISTDWNPGSAPMGDLLLQASLLSAKEKLTSAETFAAITFRAAKALNLHDRGRLTVGNIADFILFPTDNYQDILYHQGKLKPCSVWKKGVKI